MSQPTSEALYAELADWWPLISPPEDYAEEANAYLMLLQQVLDRPLGSLLELGSAGGHLASHMHPDLDVVLVDRSPQMLAASQRLNPAREHVEADLRKLRLDRRFDAVLLHDAVMYMLNEADLTAAFATVAAHLAEGGVALIVPDLFAEDFQETTLMGGQNGEDGRGVRFLEWHWDPDPDDQRFRIEFAFTLRGADGEVRTVHDRHELGLFREATWARLLGEAGLASVPIEDELGMGRILCVRHARGPSGGP